MHLTYTISTSAEIYNHEYYVIAKHLSTRHLIAEYNLTNWCMSVSDAFEMQLPSEGIPFMPAFNLYLHVQASLPMLNVHGIGQAGPGNGKGGKEREIEMINV